MNRKSEVENNTEIEKTTGGKVKTQSTAVSRLQIPDSPENTGKPDFPAAPIHSADSSSFPSRSSNKDEDLNLQKSADTSSALPDREHILKGDPKCRKKSGSTFPLRYQEQSGSLHKKSARGAAEEKISGFLKKPWPVSMSLTAAGLACLLAVTQLASCASLSSRSAEIARLSSQVSELQTRSRLLDEEKEELKGKLDRQKKEYEEEIEELKNGKDKMLVDVRNAFDQKDW